ncbi:MAG: hypothetical protein D6677_08845 [Calditrichaeota bacterium]|nr:MAG: hypothetical protein D6677_08845 [Calditrichota bacterium]
MLYKLYPWLFGAMLCGLTFCGRSDDTTVSGAAALTILYTANINGNIDNCMCGDPPLGGMDHIASYIQGKRQKGAVLYIEGGDALNSYDYPQLNDATRRIYGIIQPDVWAPGDQEFIQGTAYARSLFKEHASAIIAGNWHVKGDTGLPAFKIVQKNGWRIGLASYMEPTLPETRTNRDILFDPQKFDRINREMKSVPLSILIYHGAVDDVKQLINRFSDWDIILLSHYQQQTVFQNGHTLVVCPGSDGEYITEMVLTPHEGRPTPDIQVKQIPVTTDLPADEVIHDIIKTYQPG